VGTFYCPPAQTYQKLRQHFPQFLARLEAKYSDHLPLYRQERIFGRAGLVI
jgi:transposase